MLRIVRRRGSAGVLAVLATASLLFACIEPRPRNPARMTCFQACARDKDACVLRATTPDGIQACDAQSRACGEGCPE